MHKKAKVTAVYIISKISINQKVQKLLFVEKLFFRLNFCWDYSTIHRVSQFGNYGLHDAQFELLK